MDCILLAQCKVENSSYSVTFMACGCDTGYVTASGGDILEGPDDTCISTLVFKDLKESHNGFQFKGLVVQNMIDPILKRKGRDNDIIINVEGTGKYMVEEEESINGTEYTHIFSDLRPGTRYDLSFSYEIDGASVAK